MKKTLRNHFLTLAGIFLLCITTGCSTNETETSEVTPEPTTAEETREATSQPTAKQETEQDKLLELPQNIQDIFYGDGEFYDVSRKQTYTKKSYQKDLSKEYDNNQDEFWNTYLVADLDQDGENELITSFKHIESILVFDSQQDKVYCYTYPFRAILHVYEDGVILGSSGASHHTWYTLTFEKKKAKETIVASEDDEEVYLKGKKVSNEKFENFMQKNYGEDKELQWTEFQS